jgi:GTPase
LKFIDHVKIKVKAGDGGHGCIAFHREKFMPKGGPSGGDGGNGGNIILKANKQLTTLQDVSFNRLYKAKRGQHGQGKKMHGRKGQSITIQVPLGTIAFDSESKEILCDLTNEEQFEVIANGGNGGFGNARFKTQKNTAPRNANDGQLGDERLVDLELKIMADVGLVGFPNAGKSTLLSKVSSARPKIADYPFTTLVPNLGIVKYGAFNSFVMADIPGLIQGASDGKGLGTQFLRHIERTKILVFLLDGLSENVENDYEILENELLNHDVDVSAKPRLIFISKNDTVFENKDIEKFLKKKNTISFSSITGYNVDLVIKQIAKEIEKINDSQLRNSRPEPNKGDWTFPDTQDM